MVSTQSDLCKKNMLYTYTHISTSNGPPDMILNTFDGKMHYLKEGMPPKHVDPKQRLNFSSSNISIELLLRYYCEIVSLRIFLQKCNNGLKWVMSTSTHKFGCVTHMAVTKYPKSAAELAWRPRYEKIINQKIHVR